MKKILAFVCLAVMSVFAGEPVNNKVSVLNVLSDKNSYSYDEDHTYLLVKNDSWQTANYKVNVMCSSGFKNHETGKIIGDSKKHIYLGSINKNDSCKYELTVNGSVVDEYWFL